MEFVYKSIDVLRVRSSKLLRKYVNTFVSQSYLWQPKQTSTLIVALKIKLSMLHEMLAHLNTVQITTPLVLRCGA